MRKLYTIAICLLFCFAVFAAPSVNSRVLDSQSEIYDYMDTLYALNNKAKPNTNRPWTESQARLLLEGVDKSKQSGVALDLYNEIYDIINEGQRWNIDENFGFSVVPEINIEGYYHTNPNDFTTETQFVRSFADRKPWLKVSMDFSVSDFFWTASDLMWKTSRGSHKDVWDTYVGKFYNDYVASYKVSKRSYYPVENYYFKRAFGTNVNFDTYDFSFIWPHKAIVSVGGKNWNASINKDRMKIGDAHFGNLLVDDYTDYNDYFNLSFFNKYFTYNWYMMYFNTLTNNGESRAEDSRMYLIHTLDFRIWDRVSFKVSENVMYRYSTLDLSFLNPAYIYHNLNNRGMFNAFAYAEINAAVLPGLNIYAQYAMDQARAPNEGDSQTDASGFLFGAEYTTTLAGGVLESYAELASTTPLLYRRDEVDFIKVSRYYHQEDRDEYAGGHYPVFEYIGFPFGGDAQVVSLGTSYSIPGFLSADVSATFVQLGEMKIFTSHNVDGDNDGLANKPGKTPTGDVITRAMVLSAGANVDLERFVNYPNMSLMTELDFVVTSDFTKATKTYSNQKKDIQATIGISFKF